MGVEEHVSHLGEVASLSHIGELRDDALIKGADGYTVVSCEADVAECGGEFFCEFFL